MACMTFPEPTPQRLSDAERDSAVEALRAHVSEGRLDTDEFDERVRTALAARTASEITPLFDDLPEPHPAWLAGSQPSWNTYPGAQGAPEPGSPSASGYAYTPPGTMVPSQPAPVPQRQADGWIGALHGVIWPVAIIWMIFGHGPWWIILVAIVLSSALGGYQGKRTRNNRLPPPY